MVPVVLVAGACSAEVGGEPVTPSSALAGAASPVSDGAVACEALVLVTSAALEPLVVSGDGDAAAEIDALRAEWWRWAPPQFRDDVGAVEQAVADHLAALTELHEAAALDGRRPDEHLVLAELARGERTVNDAVHDISRWMDQHCFDHAP